MATAVTRPPANAVRWPMAKAWGLPPLGPVLDYPCLHRWGTHDGPTACCFDCNLPAFVYARAYQQWRQACL